MQWIETIQQRPNSGSYERSAFEFNDFDIGRVEWDDTSQSGVGWTPASITAGAWSPAPGSGGLWATPTVPAPNWS